MRVISPHARYSIQLFDAGEQIRVLEDGRSTTVSTRRQIVANFDKLGLRPHEEEIALSEFGGMFGALPEGVHPLTRVGVFDVEAFCFNTFQNQDERAEWEEKIEARFRELQPMFPNHFTIVEDPKQEIPWPSYDTDSIEDILMLQEKTGVQPLDLRRYEEENQKREPIISAMLEKEGVSEPDPIEVEA